MFRTLTTTMMLNRGEAGLMVYELAHVKATPGDGIRNLFEWEN